MVRMCFVRRRAAHSPRLCGRLARYLLEDFLFFSSIASMAWLASVLIS